MLRPTTGHIGRGLVIMRSFLLAAVALGLGSATLLPETLYTSRSTNAIREGAGSYYALVGSVPENTALSVMARSGSWVKVQLPNKQVGWIAANCLTPEKSEGRVARPPETMWSSPKALSAAIKAFGKKYVNGEPGMVDSVLQYADKGFTGEDLAAFAGEIRQYPSGNRSRMQIEDLNLATPEYDASVSEQQIGVGIAARIAGKGVVHNEPLHRYVNMVVAALVEHSALYDVDLTVVVLNDRTINAFAVPGGYIFVTLGLVTQCRDESELAGVLAHEVAHLYRRHGLQEVRRRIANIRADMAFTELEEEMGEGTEEDREMETIVDQTYEKIVHPRLLSYEIEADRIGSIIVANAGYDPFGLVRISERVARVSKEAPDLFDADYMLPDDAVKRSGEIRSFSELHFTKEKPGERMSSRFVAVTSSWR
jgi:hypothetical protein